jgi:hypothetical protein
MSLTDLFNIFTRYGYYVVDNDMDEEKSWNSVMNKLNNSNIISGDWNITRKIGPIITKEKSLIYNYVHNELNIKGDDEDNVDSILDVYDSDKKTTSANWKKHNYFLELINIPIKNKCTLLELCKIAYNIGKLSVFLNFTTFYTSFPKIYTPQVIEFFTENYLYSITSYIDINKTDNTEYVQIIKDLDKIISTQLGGGIDYKQKYYKYKEKYLKLKSIF